MTNEPTQGQVSQVSGLDQERVQGGVQGEGEPSTAAIRSQDGPPDTELRPDEQTDDEDPEDGTDAVDVEDSERRVGWADE